MQCDGQCKAPDYTKSAATQHGLRSRAIAFAPLAFPLPTRRVEACRTGDGVGSRPAMRMTIANSTRAPIRVLIVDDHPLLREGVAAALGDEAGIEVVGEASNGRDAIRAFETLRPDVTLMDLQMPDMNGIDAIAEIRSRFSDARIIVLTTYKGDVSALRALRAGAVGYLLKDQLRTELVEAINVVHGGGRRVPAEVAADLAAHLGDDALSEREIQVLKSVAQGNSNKRVATLLGITEETVKTHLRSIASKLNANDRTHAVTIAVRRGILEI